MPKLPGINHLNAVKAFEKAGFRVIRQGKHIVMSDGIRFLTVPRHNPINAFTMAGLVRDAGRRYHPMNTALKIFAAVVLVSLSASAEQPTFQDALLDSLIGTWVLQGSIAGRETTHDIVSEWVLGHQYVRLHEVSRDKNAKGQPAYEAIVFIGWDQPSSRYACLWLDSTGGGGLSAQAIGYAKRGGDEIAFLFKGNDGSIFHTTFAYSKGTDSWQWRMDGEEGGKLQPFARVRLTRK